MVISFWAGPVQKHLGHMQESPGDFCFKIIQHCVCGSKSATSACIYFCSPTTSYGTHEGGDDLDGVTQVGVERQQQMYVRYSGMSEGTQLIAAREEAVTKSRYLSWKNLNSNRAVAEHI